MPDIYDKVLELARRRGFVWPSSECYGSVAGFIDYGPLGSMMKRRVENIWRNAYVIREGFFEIECPTIGPERVFIASGHVKGFSDSMCRCPHCGEYFRADHLLEEQEVTPADGTRDAMEAALAEINCPVCGESFGDTRVVEFNLMFETTIGPGSERRGYLRPETAQGIFTDFSRLLRFYRNRLPFGAVQIGTSYRNEISPRQGMIRLREFTQAEAEIFVHPDEKDHPRFDRFADYRMPLFSSDRQESGGEPDHLSMREAVDRGVVANEYVAYYLALTHEILCAIGVDPDKLRFRQHLPDERAHYAADCWDAEIWSDRFRWVETVGIADRTDYDLRAHARESGDPFTVFIQYETPRTSVERRVVPRMDLLGPAFRGRAKAIADALAAADPDAGAVEVTIDGETIPVSPEYYEVADVEVTVPGEEVMPHVIEPSYGIDRMIYAVLEHTYDEEMVEDEPRRVLRLPAAVAPIQVAVFPLMTRDGMDRIATEITTMLQDHGILTQYDDSGAIGRRYRRQDEIGTPYAITVDYQTLDDQTVTIRDRDSMTQVRVAIDTLPRTVRNLLDGSLSLDRMA
ncbi:MAG: glycine--tRNA ligase [Methanomicrobiales archaeon]